jgi:hypothetical protein
MSAPTANSQQAPQKLLLFRVKLMVRRLSIFLLSFLLICLHDVETVGVMRDNLTKVQERGENLNDLQGKTDNLAVSAGQFRRGANRVRKQMWWKVRHTYQEEGDLLC